MTRRTWALLTLALLVLTLGGIMAAVIVIDPFEIYHKATAFVPPITNGTQNYSNAGIARSYDYDSVIIGSSMTENFTPSKLDEELGGHFVKLCINGGSPYNHKQMMELAFSTHEIKTVFYGLDVEALTYFYSTPKCEMPDYLYTLTPLDDVYYWFNRSVLTSYIPKCLAALGQKDEDQRDTMYSWGSLYPYGKEQMLAGLTITNEEVKQKNKRKKDPVLSQQSKLNFEYDILPYIEAHPDTRFVFFFPPYSLARWYSFYQDGRLNYHLNQKEAACMTLLQYPNVEVYDFQARTDWVTNPDNYIDSAHYGPQINDAIGECIAAGEGRITSLEQVKANDAVLESGVSQIVSAGCWPDSFEF